VMSYNNRRQSFPGSVIAGTFHFDAAAQWEIAPDKPETREAPKVQF
jgi:LemA protein